MADFMLRFLRTKLAEFQVWRSVDGRYIGLYRQILFYQGFWPALESSHSRGFAGFRYWSPRFVLGVWIYNAFLGFPMLMYANIGKGPGAMVEPLFYEFLVLILITVACCLLYKSCTFEAAVKALEVTMKLARPLPEHPRRVLDLGRELCDAQFYIVFGVWVSAVLTLFAALPFLIINRKIHVKAWYPYDETAFPYYEITLAIWALHMWLDTCFLLPCVGLLNTFLAETILHLKLLNHNLSTMRESSLKMDSKLIVSDFTNTRRIDRGRDCPRHYEVSNKMAIVLRRCVLHHQAIISFVSTIESCYNVILSLFLLGILIPAAFVVVSIQHATEFTTSLLIQLICLISVLITMAITSALATSVTDQNERVRESVYSSNWTSASESFKRSMRIIMTRCNTPLGLKVAGHVEVSLETFLEVMMTGYKLYMFMMDANLMTE